MSEDTFEIIEVPGESEDDSGEEEEEEGSTEEGSRSGSSTGSAEDGGEEESDGEDDEPVLKYKRFAKEVVSQAHGLSANDQMHISCIAVHPKVR